LKCKALSILVIIIIVLTTIVVNIPRKTIALEGWNNYIVITYKYTGTTPLYNITLFAILHNINGESIITNETLQSYKSLDGYWVKIPILYLDGLAKDDFSDIRVTDYQGNYLPMYVEKYNSTSAIVYFRLNEVQPNSEFDIIIWYNNPNAESWSGELPFYVYDDFETGIGDWSTGATVSNTTSFDGSLALVLRKTSSATRSSIAISKQVFINEPQYPTSMILFEAYFYVYRFDLYECCGGGHSGYTGDDTSVRLLLTTDDKTTCKFYVGTTGYLFGSYSSSKDNWKFYRLGITKSTSTSFAEYMIFSINLVDESYAQKSVTSTSSWGHKVVFGATYNCAYSLKGKIALDKVRAYQVALDPPIEPIEFSFEASPPTGANVYEDGTFSLDNEGCTRYRVYSDYDSSINSYTINGVANAYGEYGVEGRLKNITFNVLLNTSQSSIDHYLKYLYKDQVLVYAYGLNDYVYVEINSYNGYPIGSYSKYSPDNYTLNLVITYNYVNMVVHITENSLGIDVQLTLKGDYVFDPQYSVRVKWSDSDSYFTYYVYDRTYEGKITGLEFYIGNYQLVKVYDNIDNITVVISMPSGNINVTSKDLVYFEVYYDNGYKVVIGNSYGGKKIIDTGRTVIDNFGGSITVEGKMYYSSECNPPQEQSSGSVYGYSTESFNFPSWVILIILIVPLFIFGLYGIPIIIGLTILFGLLDIIPLWIPIGMIIAYAMYIFYTRGRG